MIRPLLWLPLVALSMSTVAANAQDSDIEEKARALHKLAGADYCDDIDNDPSGTGYEQWEITYQPDWTDDEEQKQTVTLIQAYCFSGAYNISYNFYMHDEYQGVRPIAFASPAFDVKYADDDYEGEVLGITITGMSADRELVNAWFDVETLTIRDNSKWRGIGDASSSGTWVFDQGAFSLQTYEVDASYDGEINPETLVDYRKAKTKQN
jgi:hypothetical protein